MHVSILRPILVLAAGALLCAASPQSVTRVTPSNAAERTVVNLIETAFNQKKPAEAFARYAGATYTQHNPTAADGKDAVIALFSQWLPTVPDLRYDIKRIISNRDMVWVHSHVTTGREDRGIAVVDIFRLEKGKVVEHWDVSAPVPATALNTNGVF